MDTKSYNREIALNWINAFNSKDIDRLIGLYAKEAIHFSPKLKLKVPGTNGWISGCEALRTWWEDAFIRLPSLHYALQNLIIDDNSILMEYIRKVDAEPVMMVAEILEVENGRIIRSRVYHG